MALSKQEILDGIAEMSVLDLSELIKDMEEKFGVSASAAVAVAAAPGAASAAAEVVDEQTEFNLLLTSFGDKKVGVIKAVRAITALGLKEAKDLVEAAPGGPLVKEGINKEEAEGFKKQIEEAGGTAELK